MNTKTPESDKNKIPLLIRSAQWTVAERTENQVSAVCLKNKQDEMIVQQNQKIVELNQKIDHQSKLIEQLNQRMNQQNREKDDLNNQLYLQNELTARSQNSLGIQEKNEQNKDNKKSVSSSYPTAILMADSSSNPNAAVFGSSIKRSEISAIYTMNTLEDVPSSAWDVSADRDGSVMAWTSMASDLVSYILYLAANDDIYANPDCSYLFANYTNLTAVNFSHMKTDLVTNMKYMFSYCTGLKQLDVSHWDVSRVTNMRSMFGHCNQLQALDISHWDVSNVTDMWTMFRFCVQLQALDVSHWNVSSVTDMAGMFEYCKQLQVLDVSHWNVSRVTNMHDMFSSCMQLQALDISQWNVSNVTNMDSMFFDCPLINQMNKGTLSSWKLNPAVTMKNICDGTKFKKNPMDLFQIKEKKFEQNRSKGKTVSRQSNPNEIVKSHSSGSRTAILRADSNSNPNATVFGSSIKRSEISAIYVKNTLKDMPSSAWDVSDSKDGSVMAWTQSASDSVNRILFLAANGNINANPDCSYLFANYTKLTAVDFTYLKMDMVTNMNGMFYHCINLKQLDVSLWDVSYVTDMTSMFEHCEQLQVLDVSHWNVANVTKMNFMFFYCIQLKVLDVSQWNVSSVTNMNFMFSLCKQLQTLDVSHWNVSNVTKMERIFSNCLYINHVEKGFLSSWKLNPAVSIKSICNGTKFEDNPMDLFQK
ncbi:MAG: BspA family leucine-rich repeat surface protein [Lachnospiraceae bacterium]|nr:BspA family leucine-rich repeat surface protein [Lachnospiraceae bacterium]